jgi:hypothetical protein
MEETYWQKFIKHCKNGGFFYAFFRGFKYLGWRMKCYRTKIDWRKFGQED